MTGHNKADSAGNVALGLHTDLYELRMVETYLATDMTAPATFSLFVRSMPDRPWHVALGIHRVTELLGAFRYGPDELEYLRGLGFHERTLAWLHDYRPSGELYAVADGTVVLAEEPILEYTAPLPDAQLLETALLNLIQLPTLAATKAARLTLAAAGRSVVDFGYRRTHGLETGCEVALAAYVGGVSSTSNVEAGRRYGIPVTGTMAHSFVQAFEDETEAFRTFARHNPDRTVLLVDTYDTLEGLRRAIRVADEMLRDGHPLQGIRLDSGDLGEMARRARDMLDEAGHASVRIFASGALDERRIHALAAESPIDAFGVGSDLAVSADRPALDIVYKLVHYAGRDVVKLSEGKDTLPGAKQIFRRGGPDTDVLARRDETLDGSPLLARTWAGGQPSNTFDIEAVRERVAAQIARLPENWTAPGELAEPPRPALSEALRRSAEAHARP